VAPGGAKSYDDMSLEELLEVPVSVASRNARPIREAPGVISLITRTQIEAMGARDLIDVLRQVPGFEFAFDVEGVISIGFRGNWLEEGKALLLVDGEDFSDLLYLSLPLGNRVPIDQIDHIEIIRGPGSVVYGNSAELTVINVVTRGGKELNGGNAVVQYGGTPRATARRTASLSYGAPAHGENGWSWSVSGYAGHAIRSDAMYTDFNGTTIDMAPASGLDDVFLNAGAQWRTLKLRFLADDYVVNSRDGYDAVFPEKRWKEYQSMFLSAQYEWRLTPELTLTPRLDYKRQSTWRATQVLPEETTYYYDPREVRYEGELIAKWDPRPDLDILAGTTSHEDDYWINSNVLGQHQSGLLDQIFGAAPLADTSYGALVIIPKYRNRNYAAFAQVQWTNPIADISAGARFDDNSQFGNTLVPRLAATHVFEPFHAKLLLTRAFRPPSVGDLSYNPDLKPESTTAVEAELGWKISDSAILAANVFDISIDKPLLYTSAASGTASYFNFARTGTTGAEVTFQGTVATAAVAASYSFYSAAGKNRVSDYAVPGHGDLLTGFARHKGAVNVSVPVWRGLRVGTADTWLSERFGFVGFDSLGNAVVGRSPPILLSDFYVDWRATALRNLDLRIGLYNALGSRYVLFQAYDGNHPPLPAEPRELAARLSVDF